VTLDTLADARATGLAGAAGALLALHATGRHGITYMQADTMHLRWLLGDGYRRFRLVFLDGDHTYAGLASDLNCIAPLVCDGGLIYVHDTGPWASCEPGSCRLWREMVAAGRYVAPDGRIWQPADVSPVMGRLTPQCT
jgi:hypothetical protein